MARHSRWWRHPLFDVIQFLVLVAALGALIGTGASGMGYQWKWDQVPRYLVKVVDGEWIAGPLLRGLGVTLDISWKAGVLAVLFGTGVVALRLSRSRTGPALAWMYIELIRNTPLLVQVLVFYFIVAAVLGIERLAAGVLCLALYEAAFVAEILRGGLAAVPRGQREAGLSLGLSSFRVLHKVILPQALPIMLPPLTGVLVNLVKHSAIVSVIAVFDLTTQARTIVADTFMAFEIWLVTAGLYLVITVSLSLLVAWLERRSGPQTR
ncbi:MAG: amino acid ABC transporter permease [Burkholderiales bacterium]|jgi:polar amino acid transport system permease protein